MYKKIISLALIAMFCTAIFIGCSQKAQCSFCGETKAGKTKTILGEKVFICNDCSKELSSFGN